ncbi:MAG: hypothetical protein RSC93_01845 [Erysipelotrichaceae bacterium]
MQNARIYLKTSITKFKMYVIEYKNERGISCEADFHDLKTCLDYVINDVRISCSDEIHIKKVYKYWKDSFSLAILSVEEFDIQEKAEIDAFIVQRESVLKYG